MLKYSRQRESIKNYLGTHFTHPTAETVYTDLKKEFPNISLGTVYRNLNLLAERGEILRISANNGPDHYDGNTDLHYHFVCNECGCVLDIDAELDSELDEHVGSNFTGIITGHVTHFFGVCPECCNKTNQEH